MTQSGTAKVAAVFAVGASYLAAFASFNINFTYDPGIKPEALSSFEMAAQEWAHFLNNDVTLNLSIDYSNYGPGFLGAAGSNWQTDTYHNVKSALNTHATTAWDSTAVSHLQGGDALSFYINHTAENGNSPTPYLDANNSWNNQNMWMTQGNAKALGLRNAHDTASDGAISFNSYYDSNFVFDRNGSYAPNSIDFVAVCLHEIGHQLGFVSDVDDIDYSPGMSENSDGPAVLDLYRYSNIGGGLNMDMSADNRDKIFTVDGHTQIAQFSQGVHFGDGWQASHWKHSEIWDQRYGLMDPRAWRGGQSDLMPNDLRAIDVIGWNVVPEPTSILALGLGALALLRKRRN